MALTPMMRQYFEIKENYKDCILFFRLGDFYEMFFEDAETAARELELVLTGRDCGLEKRAPMCGIPFHASNSYIGRLVAKGYKVAICEQVEDPKVAKGIVKRDVIKVITPGTYTDSSFVEETKNNYIMTIYSDLERNRCSLAITDISTGDFLATEGELEKGVILDEISKLMRMHGGSQAEMIAGAPEAVRDLFSKRVKLMSPLMKDWKAALKAENAVDFSGLIHQAVNILDKGRFVSPWKHILVDEFQDISPQRASLLAALRRQNSQTTLFAVGDDWQAIYRFSGAQLSLTTAFNHYFGEGDCCALDTTYRFNGRIGEIANGFIQQNPHQLSKPLNSLMAGDKKAVTLLADDKLDDLLDKLSGYVKPEQRILLLARYHHLKPEALNKAATRWPHLQLDFMTIHASKGQQADFVIVLGLQDGEDAFPAPARESIMEQALLPQPEDFPDAEERRLLYVALTRARHRVWLLFNKAQPSPFVEILQALDVPVARKP